MLDRKELSERLSIMKILSKSKTKFFMIIILSLLIPRLPSAALLDRVLREKTYPASKVCAYLTNVGCSLEYLE